jgi:hypothetical protein
MKKLIDQIVAEKLCRYTIKRPCSWSNDPA